MAYKGGGNANTSRHPLVQNHVSRENAKNGDPCNHHGEGTCGWLDHPFQFIALPMLLDELQRADYSWWCSSSMITPKSSQLPVCELVDRSTHFALKLAAFSGTNAVHLPTPQKGRPHWAIHSEPSKCLGPYRLLIEPTSQKFDVIKIGFPIHVTSPTPL